MARRWATERRVKEYFALARLGAKRNAARSADCIPLGERAPSLSHQRNGDAIRHFVSWAGGRITSGVLKGRRREK